MQQGRPHGAGREKAPAVRRRLRGSMIDPPLLILPFFEDAPAPDASSHVDRIVFDYDPAGFFKAPQQPIDICLLVADLRF